MSKAAKMTFAATGLGTAAIVYLVHYGQKADQAAMHEGVIRDMEQQKLKRERQLDFEMQRSLEEEYRKVQSVSGTTETGGNSSSTP